MRLHRTRTRRETGLTLIEGPHLIEEALATGGRLRRVFTTAEVPVSDHADIVVVTPEVLARIATTKSPQAPVAVLEIPEPVVPPEGDLLVAWGVGDPGNLGTLVRVAAAFGFGFVSGPGSADAWSPKVLRAAAGGHFRIAVGSVRALEDLGGRTCVATVPTGGDEPGVLAGPGEVAILIGDEANGLPMDVVRSCDVAVTIPMPGGTESLNAAVAGGILGYLRAAGRGPASD